MATVACRTGQPLRGVARESFALTLATFAEIEDMERIAAVVRRLERFDLGGIVRLTIADDGAALARAEEQYRGRFGLNPPTLLDQYSRDDLAAAARELQTELAARKWVRVKGGTPPH